MNTGEGKRTYRVLRGSHMDTVVADEYSVSSTGTMGVLDFWLLEPEGEGKRRIGSYAPGSWSRVSEEAPA